MKKTRVYFKSFYNNAVIIFSKNIQIVLIKLHQKIYFYASIYFSEKET